MIKVTVDEQKTQSEKPFPKLMKCIDGDPLIILFENPKVGMAIRDGIHWKVGCYSDSWAMEEFTDYNEPITLQNA